jgi:hypothetical protein
MVLRTSIIKSVIDKVHLNEKPQDTFAHTFIYYKGIVNARGKLVVKPLIRIRHENSGYSSRLMDIIYMEIPGIMTALAPDYSKETIQIAMRRPIQDLLRAMMRTRELRKKHDLRFYMGYINRAKGIDSKQRSILMAFAILPNSALELGSMIYKSIKEAEADN